MLVRIPQAFYFDHDERGLASPEVVRATARHFWIDRNDPALADLVADARWYAGTDDGRPGTDCRWATTAARNLLKALEGGK